MADMRVLGVCRLDFYSRVEQFLHDHMGGRAEPLLSVSDSSIKVIESVE